MTHHRKCTGLCWSAWGRLEVVSGGFSQYGGLVTEPRTAQAVAWQFEQSQRLTLSNGTVLNATWTASGAAAVVAIAPGADPAVVVAPLFASHGVFSASTFVNPRNGVRICRASWSVAPVRVGDPIGAQFPLDASVGFLPTACYRLVPDRAIGIVRGFGQVNNNSNQRILSASGSPTGQNLIYETGSSNVTRVEFQSDFQVLAWADEGLVSIGYTGRHHCCPAPRAANDPGNDDAIAAAMAAGQPCEGCG